MRGRRIGEASNPGPIEVTQGELSTLLHIAVVAICEGRAGTIPGTTMDAVLQAIENDTYLIPFANQRAARRQAASSPGLSAREPSPSAAHILQ
eukprot:11123342-Heterocapsa_arctica.AAC.1